MVLIVSHTLKKKAPDLLGLSMGVLGITKKTAN
jgi:hypothetical protein